MINDGELAKDGEAAGLNALTFTSCSLPPCERGTGRQRRVCRSALQLLGNLQAGRRPRPVAPADKAYYLAKTGGPGRN